MNPNMRYLDRPDGHRLAYLTVPGTEENTGKPGVLWLGGLHSDMSGTKATALDDWARAAGQQFVRFDYFGHGASSGVFRDGTISRWRDDALAILDEVCEGPQVLVGSSMGGWASILTALARPERVKAIQFIAPAPDFTEELLWASLSEGEKALLVRDGAWLRPSAYDEEAYEISLKLIEDGRGNLVLGAPIPITCPVRILHGLADEDVPWTLSTRLAEALQSDDVVITLVKNADHRISDPSNIARLISSVEELLRVVGE